MAARWVGRWQGRTVAVVASGPSLTEEDCERVRRAALPTIVTNTTFERCTWADALLGYDGAWWKECRAKVDASGFSGERLTCSRPGAIHGGAQLLEKSNWFSTFHNSGADAISLAITAGAARVVAIGLDCQKTGGRAHWHGDHPAPLSNARSIANWQKHFKSLARLAASRQVDVINCSRETALTCFRRAALEEIL